MSGDEESDVCVGKRPKQRHLPLLLKLHKFPLRRRHLLQHPDHDGISLLSHRHAFLQRPQPIPVHVARRKGERWQNGHEKRILEIVFREFHQRVKGRNYRSRGREGGTRGPSIHIQHDEMTRFDSFDGEIA